MMLPIINEIGGHYIIELYDWLNIWEILNDLYTELSVFRGSIVLGLEFHLTNGEFLNK